MIVTAYISDSSDYLINLDNFKKITHINYCFATVKDIQGNLNFGFKNMSRLDEIRKINPNIKISLSIGGWTAGNFSEMAESIETRTTFLDQAVEFVYNNNFDGIDMDWEYPGNGSSGISYHFNDKYNYTLLSKEMRTKLDELTKKTNKEYIMTVAVGATVGSMDSFEVDALNNYYDYINIMNYDFIGMDRVTCHHSNFNLSSKTPHKNSSKFYMDMFIEAGIKNEKLVFGLPFYGRGADKVENKGDGLGNRIYGEIPRFYDYTDIFAMNAKTNNEFYYWDEEACAPYYFDGDTFISFDDEKSVKLKMDYVREMNFAGVMFWEYALDKTGSLFETIAKEL
ncbi:MAG: glycoside hydrolase family 18 protein [Mycoplasmatales bacterium]